MSSEPESIDEVARQDGRGLVGRLARGVSSQLILLGSRILRNILIVPFFIAAHGVVGYSDWIKLMAISNFVIILAMGQNLHYNYLIRTRRAERDHIGMNQALANGNSFFLRLAFAVMVCTPITVLLIDLHDILNLTEISNVEANLVFFLLTISLFGQIYREMLRGVYMAYGELMRNDLALAAADGLLGLAVIAALLLDAPLVVIAALYMIVIPGLVCAHALWDFRRYREVRIGVSWRGYDLSAERLRNLVAHTVPQVGQRVLANGPTVLLGVFAVDAGTVVQFNLARTATNFLRGGPVAMVFAVEMSRQRIQGDRAGFRQLHRRGATVMGLFGGGVAGAFLGLWDAFLPIWTNGEVYADMTLLALMVLEVSIVTFGMHSTALLRFGGRMDDVAWGQSAAAIFFVVVGTPALVFAGIYAMLGAMALGAALFLYGMMGWYAQRDMEAPLASGLGLPLAAGLVAIPVVYAACRLLRDLVGL